MLAPHRKYKSALSSVVIEVDKALHSLSIEKSKLKKEPWGEKHLWKVNESDSGRLTRLLVWKERYGISLEYILEVLLDFYYNHLPALRRISVKSGRSLGIRIGTIVSDISFAILCEHLERDFPDGNNLAAFKEEEQERIRDVIDESLPTKSRGPLQYPSITSFVHAYTRKMETQRAGSNKVAKEMRKITWRGNPWL